MATKTETQATITEEKLREWVAEAAGGLEVVGAAVGIYYAGDEQYAFHGVTSVENPLPVDENTLLQMGSTGKTHTATAIMRLVEQGRVDLESTVRTYVPELRLKDEEVAASVTILHLLNHTAGWSGDLLDNTGDGDDALAKYVEKMATLEQVSPLGATVSYNNAALSLAGRVIEKVTGQVYEHAIKELIFEPLGMENSFYFLNEIMTRRFAAGHNQHPDGSITIARPWALARGGNPAGGISTNSRDLITWARFHLGDGRNRDGERVLSEELLKQMQKPTAEAPGSALGDRVGISWMLKDVDGVLLVSHGGDTLGQHSAFKMVPERDFAISVLTNSGPNGSQFNDEAVRWALEAYAGVVDRDPEPVDLSADELGKYAGIYETIAVVCNITPDGGGLSIKVRIKPETLAQIREAGSDPPEDPRPIPIGLLPGEGDRYIVTGGPGKGMKGYFVVGPAGEIDGIHVGGRLATRTAGPEKAEADVDAAG